MVYIRLYLLKGTVLSSFISESIHKYALMEVITNSLIKLFAHPSCKIGNSYVKLSKFYTNVRYMCKNSQFPIPSGNVGYSQTRSKIIIIIIIF